MMKTMRKKNNIIFQFFQLHRPTLLQIREKLPIYHHKDKIIEYINNNQVTIMKPVQAIVLNF